MPHRREWRPGQLPANQEYRFVSEGPEISPEELNAAFAAVAATEGTWLVASGSLPRGVPEDTYASLAATAATHGMRYVLDTSGPALTAAMGRGLALIKPSLSELEHLVGRPLPTAAEQDQEAAKLVATGAAEMVAVSLGAEGALLATREGVTRLPALKGQVRSAVGAGDAFLASMVLSLSRGSTPPDALAWGIAAGAAAVEGVGTARVTRASVEARYFRPSSKNP
jgi:6-phosphofructokinase 2